MTYLERTMARHACEQGCEAIDQPPADQGQSGAAGQPAPVSGPDDPSAVSPDPWAHLRGLSPLEQWNADGNR